MRVNLLFFLLENVLECLHVVSEGRVGVGEDGEREEELEYLFHGLDIMGVYGNTSQGREH